MIIQKQMEKGDRGKKQAGRDALGVIQEEKLCRAEWQVVPHTGSGVGKRAQRQEWEERDGAMKEAGVEQRAAEPHGDASHACEAEMKV